MRKKGIASTHNVYRGRRKASGSKILLTVLIILLAVCAIFFFLQHYIVYTSNGFHFDFPFFRQEDSGQTQTEKPDTSKPSVEEPEKKPVEPVTPAEPQQPEHMNAFEADLSRLPEEAYRTSLLQQAKALSSNAVAFRIKTEDGRVLIPTDSQYAKQASSVSPIEGIAQALTQLKQAGVSPLAVISVCRDNIAPRALRDAALRTSSGAVWLDRQSISWLAPSAQITRDYLTQLIASCKAAGFEGVILENMQYPTAGKTKLIVTDRDADKTSAVSALAAAAKTAAGEDFSVALRLTEEAAASLREDASGLDVAALSKACDYLIVDTKNAASMAALESAVKQASPDCTVVYRTASAGQPVSLTDYLVTDVTIG